MSSGYIDLPSDPVSRRAWRRQTIVGLLLLPLSLLPFAAYLTGTPEGRLLWRRAEITFAEPRLPHVASEDAAWIVENAPRYDDGVAVLVYHGIGEAPANSEQGQALTADQFGEQMAALKLAGMQPVTAAEMAQACTSGEALPPNAVMITFDDGRSEAMMFADPLLAQADMTATMFVISGASDTPGIFYAGWNALRGYARSGRWDLQGHTHALHDTLDDAEVQSPLLVNRLPGEDLDDWRDRVIQDLDRADEMIAREAAVADPVAFAYPFGAWGGDDRSNDPRIAGELRAVLQQRYTLGFVQDEQESVPLARCSDDRLLLRRLDVEPWTGRDLIAQIAAMARR